MFLICHKLSYKTHPNTSDKSLPLGYISRQWSEWKYVCAHSHAVSLVDIYCKCALVLREKKSPKSKWFSIACAQKDSFYTAKRVKSIYHRKTPVTCFVRCISDHREKIKILNTYWYTLEKAQTISSHHRFLLRAVKHETEIYF